MQAECDGVHNTPFALLQSKNKWSGKVLNHKGLNQHSGYSGSLLHHPENVHLRGPRLVLWNL